MEAFALAITSAVVTFVIGYAVRDPLNRARKWREDLWDATIELGALGWRMTTDSAAVYSEVNRLTSQGLRLDELNHEQQTILATGLEIRARVEDLQRRLAGLGFRAWRKGKRDRLKAAKLALVEWWQAWYACAEAHTRWERAREAYETRRREPDADEGRVQDRKSESDERNREYQLARERLHEANLAAEQERARLEDLGVSALVRRRNRRGSE